MQHSLTAEMETRLRSSSSSLGIAIYTKMKLLKHYVSDVAHRKVWPIAGLRCRLRRQPNTCASWMVANRCRWEPGSLKAATASVDIGELAPIVKSPFGYHIIRRDGINAVRVSHILLTWSEDGLDGRTREAAVQKAREAQAQLASGTPFKDVVSSFSDEHDAATSKGDLGWITHGQMVPDFENAIMELKVGETSSIVETPDGLHIVHRFE